MNISSIFDFVYAYSPFSSTAPTTAVTSEHVEGEHDLDLRIQALASLRDNVLKLTPTSTSTSKAAITPTPIPKPAHSMRTPQECDVRTHKEFRSQAAEITKLVERCKWLEITAKEKDKEIEELRRERDLLLQERRHSKDKHNGHQLVIKGRHGTNGETSARGSEDSTTLSSSPGSRSSPRSRVPSSATSAPPTYQEEYIAHLQSFDVFMTKTDNWSGAQIIQAVRDLNSEILQFAASATELCTFDQQSTANITQATQNTASRLGPNLANILATRDHSQDSILIQFALQSALCGCIHRSLASFCVGLPSKYDALLGQLYLRMCSTEPQPISSRWRSLAHRYIHGLFPSLESQAMDESVDLMLRWSADILMLSGSSSPNISIDLLRSRFGVQLRRVAQGACRLARVTREEIMSTNFEILAVDHGTTFDGHTMVNVFEQYGASKGRVLCTSEVGLQCFKTGSVERGNLRMLVPPKVVLESVIQVL